MTFEDTYLNDNILDALYDMRFDEMTPIQEKCIPEILDGRDLIGVAQTGTGKTAAYLLPILSMLDDGGYPKDAVNCIVMSPTRAGTADRPGHAGLWLLSGWYQQCGSIRW